MLYSTFTTPMNNDSDKEKLTKMTSGRKLEMNQTFLGETRLHKYELLLFDNSII